MTKMSTNYFVPKNTYIPPYLKQCATSHKSALSTNPLSIFKYNAMLLYNVTKRLVIVILI